MERCGSSLVSRFGAGPISSFRCGTCRVHGPLFCQIVVPANALDGGFDTLASHLALHFGHRIPTIAGPLNPNRYSCILSPELPSDEVDQFVRFSWNLTVHNIAPLPRPDARQWSEIVSDPISRFVHAESKNPGGTGHGFDASSTSRKGLFGRPQTRRL